MKTVQFKDTAQQESHAILLVHPMELLALMDPVIKLPFKSKLSHSISHSQMRTAQTVTVQDLSPQELAPMELLKVKNLVVSLELTQAHQPVLTNLEMLVLSNSESQEAVKTEMFKETSKLEKDPINKVLETDLVLFLEKILELLVLMSQVIKLPFKSKPNHFISHSQMRTARMVMAQELLPQEQALVVQLKEENQEVSLEQTLEFQHASMNQVMHL